MRNNAGRSAIQIALRRGNNRAVTNLMEFGCDLSKVRNPARLRMLNTLAALVQKGRSLYEAILHANWVYDDFSYELAPFLIRPDVLAHVLEMKKGTKRKKRTKQKGRFDLINTSKKRKTKSSAPQRMQ